MNIERNMNERWRGGGSEGESLLERIRALSFAKTETELYLDAHPEASPALEYYKELIPRLNALMDEYESKYGPLTAAGVRDDGWSWVKGKWPWQTDGEGED